MDKKILTNKILSARLAIRKEDADVLASSDYSYRFDKERDKWSLKTENNEFSQVNDVVMMDDIAVIKVDGPLSYRSSIDSIWCDEDTYDSIERAFSKCLSNDNIKGVIFDINSPGGEVNGCADLADKIFNARGSKPYGIVARTGGMMCSAAYWLGSSCEKVFTASNGTLGSIGVLCAFTKFKESILETTVVTSDLSPDKNPDPADSEGLALIKKELNDLAEVFIAGVARNRATTVEDVKMNFGKGGVFIGENAVAANLADGVMSLDEICKKMKQGMSLNGGAFMATKVNGAEAACELANVEALKAQAVAAYKQRVASMNGVFDGLDVTAEEKNGFIDDESKTVADAALFALEKAKEKIKAQAAQLSESAAQLEAAKNAKPSGTSEKERALAALEASAAAQNAVHAGNDGASESRIHAEKVRREADDYYAKRRR